MATAVAFTKEEWDVLTADERKRVEQLVRQELEIGRGTLRRPKTFAQFIDYVNPRFKWYRYAEVLVAVLQDVVDGLRKRVIVVAPPRHGKSEPVSRLLPAYFLYRFPEKWVGLTSYGERFAATLARAARQNYLTSEGKLQSDVRAVVEWQTGYGGGMWAAGAGGPMVGRGFHLGIIDDPVKNWQEAASELKREAFKEWYGSTYYTRLEPGGAVVIIMQRWGEDDPVGYLLQEEWASQGIETGLERWHIVHFEALKEDPVQVALEEEALGQKQYPPSCTLEPDWRLPGMALSPARYSRERLLRVKDIIGNYYFNAMYQQRPRAREGLMFPPDKWNIVSPHEFDRTGLRLIRFWDRASTPDGGDYTAGTLMGMNVHRQFCVFDFRRGQWGTLDRDRRIRATAQEDFETWGGLVKTWGEQEPGSAGKDMALQFVRLLAGYDAHTLPVTGDKTLRAEGYSAAQQGGNVSMVRAPWNAAFRRSHADFPNGKWDDDVDSASQCFNLLTRKRQGPTAQRGSMIVSTLT